MCSSGCRGDGTSSSRRGRSIDDPFGLARAEVELAAGGALLVYPRLVPLDRLFSESGAHAQDGRRLLLRRPSGFDLHSVREYEQGESLRKVHWRTTARRGQLMVKELEDAPRDEIAVLLDAEATAVSGESFDVQVRAAGSILRAHAAHGRRAVLAVNSASRPSVRVSSLDGEWLAALGLLAEAQPDGTRPLVELLARESGPASRALETVVVTARLSGALATTLVQRALAAQGVSVVWIDAPSFAGRPTRVEPELLRLQAAGRGGRGRPAGRLARRRARRRAGWRGAPMARTAAVYAFPAALIALVWLRLEERPVAGPEWFWVVLLALLPALAPTLWLRLALVVPAGLVGLWVALGTSATDDRPGFFEPVFLRFDDGFFDYYDVTVPFNGVEHPNMHGVLVLAIFGFCLVLAQFDRRAPARCRRC